jgi:uncharacterized protein YdaU (DUF1376 family)
MHYYQHHIGDFIKATARLSDAQTMAYLRLLWMYYDSEKPLKPDAKVLAFQIGATVEDTELLLESFFVLCENGWHQTRCDKEIQEYREFLNKKSNAGKASAERRKNNRLTGVEQVLNNSATDVQLTTNHSPLTTNQDKKIQRGSRIASDFQFPKEWEDFCVEQRPELNATKTFEQFKDYWIAQAGQKGVKLDWFATWRNWVRNTNAPKVNFADIGRVTVPSNNQPDPALEKIKADAKMAAPIPLEVLAKMAALRKVKT